MILIRTLEYFQENHYKLDFDSRKNLFEARTLDIEQLWFKKYDPILEDKAKTLDDFQKLKTTTLELF